MREHTKSEKKCRLFFPSSSSSSSSIDRSCHKTPKKKERKKERDFATQTNSSRITPPTQHPGKKSEKKNKRSVVRSFVRHGRWRHPNEEEHLVETETTRWRGRRVRTFFFRRHFPLAFVSLFSLPDGKNVRAFVRADASSSSSFFCVPKSSSGSPGRQIQNRKRLHR